MSNEEHSKIIHNYLAKEELKNSSLKTSKKLFLNDFQMLKYSLNLKFDPINVQKEKENIRDSRKLYNFIKEESDNISQLMALTILLNKIGEKKIHYLENEQISNIFQHPQKRSYLIEQFKDFSKLEPTAFIEEYFKACKESNTRIIPCLKEFKQ